MENARAIIDFAAQDNGTSMRDALYAGIHDKIMAHIEAKKQEVALNLIVPNEQDEVEDSSV
jgi:hypothetical protein